MQKQIKIIHVMGIMNLGGAEIMALEMLREIDRSQYSFDFVVHSKEPGQLDAEIKSLGSEIFFAPKPAISNILEYCLYWDKFFKKREKAIVHCHMHSVAPIVLYYAKKHGHITIAHSHTSSAGEGIKSQIKKVSKRLISFVADYRVACSKKAGKWLFGKNFGLKNDFIWNNALNADNFKFDQESRRQLREKYNVEDKIVIGMVSSLNPVKNHTFMLKVLENMPNRSNYKLIIIGSGPEQDKLTELISSNDLEKDVKLLGNKNPVSSYYNMFDIFILPSLFEGFPLTSIEAQFNGLNCLVSNNVTREINFSNNVTFLKLEQQRWIDHLQNKNNFVRHGEINNKDYDIKYYIEEVESFYDRIL